jgi:hypothetical protein
LAHKSDEHRAGPVEHPLEEIRLETQSDTIHDYRHENPKQARSRLTETYGFGIQLLKQVSVH